MLCNGYIAYAIIEVRGNTAEETSSRMGAVAKLATDNGAVTDAMVSAIIIISRGTVPSSDSNQKTEPFTFLLVKIVDLLKQDVRITHASELADFGNLGNESRFAYSFIAPSFGKALSALLSTEFGKIVEVA